MNRERPLLIRGIIAAAVLVVAGTVAVVVVAGDDGSPDAAATVHAEGSPEAGAESDAEGRPGAYALLIDEGYARAHEGDGQTYQELQTLLRASIERLGRRVEGEGASPAVAVTPPVGDAAEGIGTGILVFNTTDAERVLVRLDVTLLDASGDPATAWTRFLEGDLVSIPARTAFFFGAVFPPEKVLDGPLDFSGFSTMSDARWDA